MHILTFDVKILDILAICHISKIRGENYMYFLDANAWYWYYGRASLGMSSTANVDEQKLITELNRIERKSIPTSVYIEVVTHFRDNPELLQKLLEHMAIKDMKIYNNIPDYVITPEEMEVATYVKGEKLKNYAYKMLSEKITIETRFIYIFVEIMSLLFFAYRLETKDKLTEEEKYSIESWIRREYRNCIDEDKTKEIKDALYAGYMNKDEQRVIKKKYIEILNRECVFIEIILDAFVAVKENKKDIVSLIQTTYEDVVRNGLDGQNGTMDYIKDVFLADEHFLSYAKDRFCKMFEKHRYTKMQRLYLKEVMFDAWMNRGQKLRKNDIFDMFCVGALDCKNSIERSNVLIDNRSYLISFDSTMEQFISEKSIPSSEIINRYKIV